MDNKRTNLQRKMICVFSLNRLIRNKTDKGKQIGHSKSHNEILTESQT